MARTEDLYWAMSFCMPLSDIILVPCCMNWIISTTVPSQKIVPINFLMGRYLSKYLWLIWWICLCIHIFDCFIVSMFTNETPVSLPVTHTTWLRNSSPSSWYPSKAKAYCNVIKNSALNLWKLTNKFCKYETPSFT